MRDNRQLHTDRRERLTTASPEAGYRPPGFVRRDRASARMIAAMAAPHSWPPRHHRVDDGAGRLTPFSGEAAESEAQYYSRRSADERRAAREAAGSAARSAHSELAARYAALAQRAPYPENFAGRHGAAAERARLAAMLRRRFGRPDGVAAGNAIGFGSSTSGDAAGRPLAGPSSRAAQAEVPASPVRQPHRLPAPNRSKRLDDRLDQALLETFPASDPVSIAYVR